MEASIFALYFTRTYFIDGKNIRHVLPVKCNLLNLPLFVIPVGSYTSLSIVVYKILCYTQCTQLYFPKYLGTKFSTGTCTVVAYPPGKFMQFIFLIIFFLRRPEKTPIGRYYAKIDKRNFIPMIPKGVDGPRGGVCRVLWNFNGPKNR